MLGRRTPPVIGKISDLLISGNRTGFVDVATSPRSPLELKIQSPRGLKNYDLGGVGLAIVAALEKSSGGGCEILAKYAVCSPNLNRSEPIPVNSGKNCARFSGGFEELEMEMENLEDYTFVTCRGPNKSITRVYYDGGHEYGKSGHETRRFDRRLQNRSVFSISPAICADDIPAFPTSDFLSSCQLCRKKLHGKDIYMYRGEKAFCSAECRGRQIVMEECKERCRTEVSRSADVTNSAYARSEIFSTGILAI